MGDTRKTERNAEIIALHREGFSCVEIANAYGVTRTRVAMIVDKYGGNEKLLSGLTLTEVCRRLGFNAQIVRRAVRNLGPMPKGCFFLRFGKVEVHPDRLEMVRAACRKHEIANYVKCTFCGKELRRPSRNMIARRFCCGSIECRRKWNDWRNKKTEKWLLETAPSRDTVLPRRVPAIVLEATRTVDELGEAISFSEAQSICGLTKMQLVWLRRRRMISTKKSGRYHPVTKKQIRLYSKNEMLAIWHAIQAAKRDGGLIGT